MFQAEKPLGRIFTFVLDQLLLNMLFLLCSMPVITIGAAAIALYEQEYAVWERRDSQLIRSFLRSVLRNFLKGLALLGIGVILTVAGLGIWSSLILLGLPARWMAGVVLIIVGGIFLWFLGLTGRYEQKMGTTFGNAFTLAIQKLPVTLLLALVNLGYPAAFLVMPESLLSGYLFVLLFLFWAAAAWLSAGLLLKALRSVDPGASAA